MQKTGPLMKSPELCEICQCECNEYVHPQKKYTKYFSIAEATTNTDENMVLTGIKFESKFGIIYPSVRYCC